jgi:hypothetical protein
LKRLAVLGIVVAVGAIAGATSDRHAAAAAETHSNCIQFDQNGNFVGVTPNCTMTISMNGGQPESFPSVNPCTGDTGTIDIAISHQVYHINVNGAGDAWDSGTQSGTVSWTPDDASAPSGAGSMASWFGDSFNAQNMEQSFTFHASIHLSNGQTISMGEVGHVTFAAGSSSAPVPVVAFDKPTVNCGG